MAFDEDPGQILSISMLSDRFWNYKQDKGALKFSSVKQMVGWLIFSCLTQSCFQNHTQVCFSKLH